jgi:hypothetical protein
MVMADHRPGITEGSMRRVFELLVAAVLGAVLLLVIERVPGLLKGAAQTQVEVHGDVMWQAVLADTFGSLAQRASMDSVRAGYALARGGMLALLFSGRKFGVGDAPAHVAVRIRPPWSKPSPWVMVQADEQTEVAVGDSMFMP